MSTGRIHRDGDQHPAGCGNRRGSRRWHWIPCVLAGRLDTAGGGQRTDRERTPCRRRSGAPGRAAGAGEAGLLIDAVLAELEPASL